MNTHTGHSVFHQSFIIMLNICRYFIYINYRITVKQMFFRQKEALSRINIEMVKINMKILTLLNNIVNGTAYYRKMSPKNLLFLPLMSLLIPQIAHNSINKIYVTDLNKTLSCLGHAYIFSKNNDNINLFCMTDTSFFRALAGISSKYINFPLFRTYTYRIIKL